MANGYDAHSLAKSRLNEAASSTDMAPLRAVRDKRFTRSGIGWRSEEAADAAGRRPAVAREADYPGGVATRRRGEVNEAALSWEAAQEATQSQIRPRDTLPPSRMDEALPPWLKGEDEEREALPPWLRDKEDDEEEREALPPWLRDKEDEEEREADRPDMEEAPLDAKRRGDLDSSDFALPNRRYPIDTPSRARSALARVKQFGSPEEQRKVKTAVKRKYPNMDVE